MKSKYKIGDLILCPRLNVFNFNEVGVVTGKKMIRGYLVYFISYIDSFTLTIYTYDCPESYLMPHSNIYEI